ncbi:hypothetical protein [Bacteroides sp.]|uniref:hypothetical protein n=1 Tax=Bacteroides sp. TaxID=29523 RepID=UPI0026290037|nr:hypothetical protein [Bacteroides sp.]MDD3037388.1 hypothetical protein [Bacteroides sp.]
MIRYIFCILLGILLISVLHSVPDKERQKIQTESGVTGTPSYSQSNHQFSESADEQSYTTKSSAYNSGNKEYDYSLNSGILGNSFSYSGLSYSKVFRFNISTITILILSFLIAQLPKESNGKLSFYINSTRLSYRYYIYTLKRILI